jgi:hypothetical protein
LSLQRLLAQLKNKGWLGEAWAEKTKKQMEYTKKYGWMQGTWSETFTDSDWTHCGWARWAMVSPNPLIAGLRGGPS